MSSLTVSKLRRVPGLLRSASCSLRLLSARGTVKAHVQGSGFSRQYWPLSLKWKKFLPSRVPHWWPSAIRRASWTSSDFFLSARLRLLQFLRIRRRKRILSGMKPPIAEGDFKALQREMQRLLVRWELQADQKSVEHPHSSVNPGSAQEYSSDLSSRVTADSIHIEAQKLTPEVASSDTLSKEESSLSRLGSVLRETVSLFPQMPLYLSSLAQDKIFQKIKAETPADVEKTAATSTASSVPQAKRLTGRSVVSKSVVDSRTRFCVQALREDPSNTTVLLRRLETLCTHLHHFPYAKGVAVRENAIGLLLHLRQKVDNDAIRIQLGEALDLLGYHDPVPGRGLRILSLDGGGMKGIVALEVLKVLEQTTGKRIHEIFDFMCGVSTGAIILAFLAFHKLSVREIEGIYDELGRRVFSRDVFRGTTGWVMSHSYYDTKLYEETLLKFVGNTMLSDTLRNGNTPLVAIVSTLVSGNRISPFIFRNYHYPYRTQSFYQGSARYAIWESVRASSAAPGYFDEFLLDDKIFHDGGILTNNATSIAIHEAQKLWPDERVHCVVSLGMGRHEIPIHYEHEDEPVKPKALSLAQKFSRIVDAATDTEITDMTLRDLLPGNVYFRFNPYLSEYFPLDEVRGQKMSVMREDTKMYLRRNHNRVVEACHQLNLPRGRLNLMADAFWRSTQTTKARLQIG